jgi:flagellar hook capping protein FlgD
MIKPPFATLPSRRAGPLLALAAVLLAAPTTAAVLMQDTGDEATAEDNPIGRWESFAVSSSRSQIFDEGQGMKVVLAPGDRASFARAADLPSAPSAVICTFNVSLSGIGDAEAASQVLRMGWDFAASNGDESELHTYAALGLTAAPGADAFQLRSPAGGGTSPVFTGTQAVSWVLNNSGRPMTYAAPNGAVEAVGDDRMDVWVGRTRVFDDVLASQPAGRITDLKWYWSRGSGVTAFDRFQIRTLDEATGAPAAATAEPTAADADPAAALRDGAVTLGRPMPNPFTAAMRFAYAIPGPSAHVDIGVFDVAGRRIRILAHGTQTTGVYEASWDGLGDDGSRVQYGMYFLRAAVGTERTISRVMYLHE